jgi:hypothetical protein
MAANAANGDWENYHVANELNTLQIFNYKNGKFSLKFLPDGWKFQLLGDQVTRSILHK